MLVKELKTPMNMTHNTFNLNDDFIEPVRGFLEKIDKYRDLQGKYTMNDHPKAPNLLILESFSKNVRKLSKR